MPQNGALKPAKAIGSGAPELDWSLRTGGYGSVVGYPAKYSFDIAESNCADVNYFTVNQTGSWSRVNVIAITNSYAGCPNNSTGKTPTVRFGLRLTSGTATSPVPSLDGETLYVFESRSTSVILHAINVSTATYLVRIPYNGVTLNTDASAMGYATLARWGSAATVGTSPVTEFLTASTLSNPDFIYIGGSGGTYTYMNRIASQFAGTSSVPVPMANSFAVPGGVSSGISIDTRTTLMTGTTATANIYFGTVGIASTTQSTIVQLAQQF